MSDNNNSPESSRNILFLESFYGGSHKYFADGLVHNSRHKIDLVTLPGENWSWRMLGSAMWFAQETVGSLGRYDALLVSDLMGLADFRALAGGNLPPVMLYFHENQVTYPDGGSGKRGFQYGFTDVMSALVADRIAFNSHVHCRDFLEAVEALLNRMPDYRPTDVAEVIRKKSMVLYPGCDFPEKQKFHKRDKAKPPLVIWNHRWAYDKNPGAFFQVMDEMLEKGLEFRLALMGENFGRIPSDFSSARERYGDRVVQFGYVETREKYVEWLKQGAVVVSTATQENFGISMVEAMHYGSLPMLPRRLSYPEILPECFHGDFIYTSKKDLSDKLSRILSDYTSWEERSRKVSESMGRYSWDAMIHKYDNALDELSRMEFSL